jgi:hypothetical protein
MTEVPPLENISNIDTYHILLDEAIKEGKDNARERIDVLQASKDLKEKVVTEKYQRDITNLFPPTKNPVLTEDANIWHLKNVNRQHIAFLVLWHIWFFMCLWAI